MFSASPDATIRIWSVPNTSCVQVVRAHESAVTGLSLHATGDYLLSSSDDQVQSQSGGLEEAAFSSREEGAARFPEFGKCFFSMGTNSARGICLEDHKTHFLIGFFFFFSFISFSVLGVL